MIAEVAEADDGSDAPPSYGWEAKSMLREGAADTAALMCCKRTQQQGHPLSCQADGSETNNPWVTEHFISSKLSDPTMPILDEVTSEARILLLHECGTNRALYTSNIDSLGLLNKWEFFVMVTVDFLGSALTK